MHLHQATSILAQRVPATACKNLYIMLEIKTENINRYLHWRVVYEKVFHTIVISFIYDPQHNLCDYFSSLDF